MFLAAKLKKSAHRAPAPCVKRLDHLVTLLGGEQMGCSANNHKCVHSASQRQCILCSGRLVSLRRSVFNNIVLRWLALVFIAIILLATYNWRSVADDSGEPFDPNLYVVIIISPNPIR